MQKCKSTLFYNTLDLMYMVQCHDIVCIKFGLWRPWQVSCWNNEIKGGGICLYALQ